ncbi:MAG: pseudouridine synthase [Nitrospinae bacterium]|nr:pseudouridine synthase [Nitrospinota bacterium]
MHKPSKRINKFFTEHGFCSRRMADQLIEAGRVRINGRTAALGDRVTEHDVVELDGRAMEHQPRTVYLAYHKPVGITSTTELHVKDNIIHAVKHPDRIFPIGRLDKDSSGLILLTNHGDIVNRILRVEFGHEREYRVTLDRPYAPDFVDRMSRGVTILGRKTKPCHVHAVDARTFRIILTEGLNRQIRRMCFALKYRVVKLVRTRIMHIQLKDLPAGKWRRLTPREEKQLIAAVGLDDKEAARP